MRNHNKMLPVSLLVLVLAAAAGLRANGAPSKTAKPAQEPNAAATPEAEIPQSVFVIPTNPREGRNPFFPHSIAAAPAPKAREVVLDTSGIVLNGVTSRPTPTVMINGVTFEKGEEHEIKLPSGAKIKVRCDEIRENSALIQVNGLLQRELRLRAGL